MCVKNKKEHSIWNINSHTWKYHQIMHDINKKISEKNTYYLGLLQIIVWRNKNIFLQIISDN